MNQIFTVLLTTSMVVGGIVAFILDNLLPGSEQDRGIVKWRSLMVEEGKGTIASIHVYDLPFGVTNKWTFTKHIPFLPYYSEDHEIVENDLFPIREVQALQHEQQQTCL